MKTFIIKSVLVITVTRIDEALAEGLDAISITEHIEYRPKLAHIPTENHDQSYEIAKDYAERRDIILIKGTEVTREMTPGHFNAIFIQDANPFAQFVNKENPTDGSNIVETLGEGVRQNAFIFWNHPWFPHREYISEWADIHEELYQKGLIKGIEVVNGRIYEPKALDWCIDKKLAVIASSDFHEPSWANKDEHRPMTLVFARERSAQAIREALDAGRTVAYLNNEIFGQKEWVGMIVNNALKFEIENGYSGASSRILRISNNSSIPFTLKVDSIQGCLPRINPISREIKVPAHGLITLQVNITDENAQKMIRTSVKNAHVRSDENLIYDIIF